MTDPRVPDVDYRDISADEVGWEAYVDLVEANELQGADGLGAAEVYEEFAERVFRVASQEDRPLTPDERLVVAWALNQASGTYYKFGSALCGVDGNLEESPPLDLQLASQAETAALKADSVFWSGTLDWYSAG